MKNSKLSGILWAFGAICFLFIIIINLLDKKYMTSIGFAGVCFLYIINAVVNLKKKTQDS